MPKGSGLGQQFYLHGYDLSNDIASVPLCGSPREALTVTGIDKSAVERIHGRSSGVINLVCYFNDATRQAHAGLSTLVRTNVIAVYATGSSIDDTAGGLVAKQINYDPSRDEAGNLTIDVQALGQGSPLEWGVMLTSAQDTHGSAGSSASKDDSASSAAGLIAYLEVVDIDSGTPTVVLEHSANDSSWSALITFTAVANGDEPTAERKTVSGTVNRYLRVTTTGTFSNLDFAIMYRRGESTDD